MIPLYAENDVTLCKECHILGKKNLAAQGMYWRILIRKQTSKAMLKLVCWFYFQVLAVLYFLPCFQVTFWGGAQKPWEKKLKPWENQQKNEHHKMWLSRHEPTTHGPPLVCFFPIDFSKFWAEVAKTSRAPKKANNTKKHKPMDVQEWLGQRLF